MLSIGDAVPAGTYETHTGTKVSLEGFRGKKILLWFYPMADTPG